MSAFDVSYVVLWVVVVVQGVLLLLVYRHFGMMTLGTMEGVQRDGLPIGEDAPALSGVTARGEDVLWEPSRARPNLVLFATPDCEPCRAVLPYVNQLAALPGSLDLEIAAIVPGPREGAERMEEEYNPRFTCLADDGAGAFDSYRVRVTPFAFVVGEDGRVRSKGLCSDSLMLRDLLVAGGLSEPTGLAEPLPLAQHPAPVDREVAS